MLGDEGAVGFIEALALRLHRGGVLHLRLDQVQDLVAQVQHPLEAVEPIDAKAPPLHGRFDLGKLCIQPPFGRGATALDRVQHGIDGRVGLGVARRRQTFAVLGQRHGPGRLHHALDLRLPDAGAALDRVPNVPRRLVGIIPLGRHVLPERVCRQNLHDGSPVRIIHVATQDVAAWRQHHAADRQAGVRLVSDGGLKCCRPVAQGISPVSPVLLDDAGKIGRHVAAVAMDRVLAATILVPAVHGAIHGAAAKDVPRVFLEVPVDAHGLPVDRDLPLHVKPSRIGFGGLAFLELLEEHDVGDDIGPGVFLEGVVRQADRPDHLEGLCQDVPGFGVCRVEEAVSDDNTHDAARTKMQAGLGDDVVVDLHARKLRPLLVPDRLASERRVADHDVERAIGEGRHLKTGRGQDVGIGVKVLGNLAGDRNQLGCVPFGARGQVLRFQPDEVAGPDGRLKSAAATETEVPHGVPHAFHHGPRCVMRVPGRGHGGLPFLRGQKLFQVSVCAAPLVRLFSVPAIEGVRQSAPADIARQCGLFLCRGEAVLSIKRLDDADRSDVCGQLLAVGAFTKREVVGDDEIARALPFAFGRVGLYSASFSGQDVRNWLRTSAQASALDIIAVQSFISPSAIVARACAWFSSHFRGWRLNVCGCWLFQWARISDLICSWVICGLRGGRFHHTRWLPLGQSGRGKPVDCAG